MRIAVTGATGFIGTRLVVAARARGWEVVALSRDPGWARSLFADGGVETQSFSLDSPALPDVGPIDALCHLAAVIPTDVNDPSWAESCFRYNAVAAHRVATACIEAGVPQLVFFSAGNVYRDSGRAALESDPAFPDARAAYYLSSKLAGEILVSFAARDGLALTVLRPSAVYGPTMSPKALVPLFCRRAVEGLPLIVRDGGLYSVDLVHADDVADAALGAIERRRTGTFNLGTGVGTSVGELAAMVLRLAGRPADQLAVRPATTVVHTFPPLDSSRARAELDFNPRPITAGVAEFIRTIDKLSPDATTPVQF